MMQDRSTLLTIALALMLCAAPAAEGATRTWRGWSSALWWDSNNWENGLVPTGNEDVVFKETAAITFVAYGNALTQSVIFSGERPYSLSAGTFSGGVVGSIRLGTGDLSVLSVNTRHVINGGIMVNGSGTWNIGGTSELAATGEIKNPTFGAVGPGQIIKTGTGSLVLSGASTYTGGTTISQGTLSAQNESGSATGTGGITVADAGILTGDGSAAGTTTVQAGGVVAPGASLGTLTLGEVRLETGSALELELGGTSIDSDYDRLLVSGLATLEPDTTLNVMLSGGFTPGLGDTFTLLAASAIVGDFTNINLPVLGAGLDWLIMSTPSQMTLEVISATLQGDLDRDGFVGIADLSIVLSAWNSSVTPGDLLAGDATGDGFVGIEDLNLVLGAWNVGSPPPPAAVVPEPASLAMLGLGAVLTLSRGRR